MESVVECALVAIVFNVHIPWHAPKRAATGCH